jgi:hypothetical protein
MRYQILISPAFVLALGADVFSGLAIFKATHAPTSVGGASRGNATTGAASSVSIASVVVSTRKSPGTGVLTPMVSVGQGGSVTSTKGPDIGSMTPTMTAVWDGSVIATSRSLVQITVVATRAPASARGMATHRSGHTQGLSKRNRDIFTRDEALAMGIPPRWDATSTVTVTHVSTVHMLHERWTRCIA